jgi:uncharacterized protein
MSELKRLYWRLRTRHWFRYEPTPLVVHSKSGEQHFTVDVARSNAERNFGLSWRGSLPVSGGMLFVYPDAPVISMWMRNTYIALDMLFIAPSGHIDHIAANQLPHAEGDVSSGRPTLAVLELAGGTAARLGLQVGDSVGCTALPASQPTERA